ncbi:7956_t:CDS:2, partial [Gigaspora rosea]
DQYNCSKVNPNMIKILKCIEELQESMNKLQNENGSLQKNEAILKDTIFAVKNENSQLLEKIKQLQKTTMNNHMENNDGVIANVIPTQRFMNLENENKQHIEKVLEQNQRISKILKIFEIAIQKYEEAVNNLDYRIEVA